MINGFSGEFRFLSNFHEAPVFGYPSTENAYQAAKTTDPEERKKFRTCTPKESKRLGRSVKLRPDWERIKLEVMETLVREKFSKHEDLKQRLLATREEELVEGNYWHDNFWGSCSKDQGCKRGCPGKGQNHLGKILMKIRKELQG